MTVAVAQKQAQVKWCKVAFDQNNKIQPPQLERNTWVQLLEKLNPFSDDEALLLCKKSETEWVAWIPNHGEAVLNVGQFCCPVND